MPDGSLISGRSRKGIVEALKGSPQNGRKPFEECKGRRELDCDTDGWSRYESRDLSDPVVLWECHRSTDKKSLLGITGLSPQESSHDGSGLAPRCRLIASWGCSRSKGWAVRPLKRYASWVQNVVRQFGPYPGGGVDI